MLGHLGRGDGCRGPQIQSGLVDGLFAPLQDKFHAVLVGDGEDPEGSLVAEVRWGRADPQVYGKNEMVCYLMGHRYRYTSL